MAGLVACVRASKSLRKFDKGESGERSLIIPRIEGKAIPVQAWTGSEGSRRLRPPGFVTIAT